jgi:hypothetical protein
VAKNIRRTMLLLLIRHYHHLAPCLDETMGLILPSYSARRSKRWRSGCCTWLQRARASVSDCRAAALAISLSNLQHPCLLCSGFWTVKSSGSIDSYLRGSLETNNVVMCTSVHSFVRCGLDMARGLKPKFAISTKVRTALSDG